MKILYKQTKNNNSLEHFGVRNCYFKKILFNRDFHNITKKTHHHNGFEIHIIVEGTQEYEIQSRLYKLEEGDFLIISPHTRHTFLSSSANTLKYAFTFDKDFPSSEKCFTGKAPERVFKSLEFASLEALLQKEISKTLIENTALEILVSLFRLSGIKENPLTESSNENTVVALAKSYIDDNIEYAPTVSDVADYCHLSTKQFTRIFHSFEGTSPGEYITKKRVERIETLLLEEVSLKEISDKMHFSSEYYFNSFFTHNAGMSPGKFRKMQGK